ncbi:MAG TPA: 5-dehydro-4-deoxy-D-glucuronate isomerase [Terriglobales bacterium]|jgi:4-deoxy-L-threo-5-hexosulose-uronate ketol-isomerase|nr:5-dehydro-4-deoxy-D-glucuronate isomerase [Terriglobales bacterium]
MRLIEVADAVRYPRMTTEELRRAFLVEELFQPGSIDLVYVDLDRTVIGSAVPLDEALTLSTDPDLRADYFTERRELGILNIGGTGSVAVDGQKFELISLDALYVGRGGRDISFRSDDASTPAQFYLLSYPAHSTFPITKVEPRSIDSAILGSTETANHRKITRLIHLEGARSCQLVMGVTTLITGSVWNTMPPHTHMRRSEVYLYFNLAPADRVIHLMGPAHETRHVVVANRQVVISPGWSIHAGVGTSSYSFCWGMGGENQVYTDMDPLAIADLV